MSETPVEKYDGFCSQINDKPVDAIGHMVLCFDFDLFESPFQIEKVFGFMIEEANLVLKFKLIMKETKDKETNEEIIKFKLIYLNEESIECKIEENYLDIEEQKTLNIGDKLASFVYQLDELKDDPRIDFCIGLILNISLPVKYNLISRKFNDTSSTDFIIECQNEKFHVHQMILKDQSEYFEAILRNNCKENDEKRMIIDDFEPKVVEIFLRQIYNSAFCAKYTHDAEMAINLLKIADKYNVTTFFDAIDSHLAQSYVQWNPWNQIAAIQEFKDALKICEETGAPKLSTMLSLNKNKMKHICALNDKEWSNLIRKHPNFALVATITDGREDYQSWLKQHRSWCLNVTTLPGHFAPIVGKLGVIKGATQCCPV